MGPPVTNCVVAPAVPLRVTSPVTNPVAGSLNTTVKLIVAGNVGGEPPAGSACVAARLMVTVGPRLSKVTVLSMLTEAALGRPERVPLAPPPALEAPAAMEAITVPLPVMPLTATLYVLGPPVTVTVLVPGGALPVTVTSVLLKPVTASLKTTVKLIGDAAVGSD